MRDQHGRFSSAPYATTAPVRGARGRFIKRPDAQSRDHAIPEVFDGWAGSPAPAFLSKPREPVAESTPDPWGRTCFMVAVAIGLICVAISMLALAHHPA